MDANKEESDRCLKIAIELLNEGDNLKALKFLRKAEKLNPSTKIRELIKKCLADDANEESTQNGFASADADYSAFDQYETTTRSRFHNSKSQPDFSKQQSTASYESTNSGGSSTTTTTYPNDENHNNSRNRSKSRNRTSSSSTSSTSGNCPRTSSNPQLGVDFTEEQLQDVQRVRHCKDYYEILNVPKDFKESDLKKQYKRLALQFHPDKNRAPGATEAFKAISNAYAVLSNPKKREQYDMFGNEPATRRRHRNDFYEYDYSRGFEGDMNADEIFSMFFGGGFANNVHRRQYANYHYHFRRSSQEEQQRNESPAAVIFQLMPILILIALSLLSQLIVPEVAFSLHRTEKFSQERRTGELGVLYYVKNDFMKQYAGNVYRVEQQVEEEYVHQLRTNCFRERNIKETSLWRAKSYGDAGLYEKAQALRTPSCDRLAEIAV